MKSALPALVCALLAAPAFASDAQRLVVVLPVDARSAGTDSAALEIFEEQLRSAAADALTPLGYVVLARENTLALLADKGIDPEEVSEASSALDVARRLGASLLVSSLLGRDEDLYIGLVRAYDVDNGAQVVSLNARDGSSRKVRDRLVAQLPGALHRRLAPVKPALLTLRAREAMSCTVGASTRTIRAGDAAVLQLEPRSYVVICRADGYEAFQDTVDLREGAHETLLVELTKLPPSPTDGAGLLIAGGAVLVAAGLGGVAASYHPMTNDALGPASNYLMLGGYGLMATGGALFYAGLSRLLSPAQPHAIVPGLPVVTPWGVSGSF